MNCKGCGSQWFIEERQVLPLIPLEPTPVFAPAHSSRVRWAYRCAACGLGASQEPKPKRTKKKS